MQEAIRFIDTHAHLQAEFFKLDANAALERAKKAGVGKIMCVGTDVVNSDAAVKFVQDKPECWATIGLHPHDSKQGTKALTALKQLVSKPKVIGVGECGLDYYYNHSSKSDQEYALNWQIELAQAHNLPCVFHVRDAFDDFFKIIDNFKNVRGVVHSFTADSPTLDRILERGLLVGLNGIVTFSKDEAQLRAVQAVPLANMILETDCPFLTPVPLRGKINEPANVPIIAEFLANFRGESIEEIAIATSKNATNLFNLN